MTRRLVCLLVLLMAACGGHGKKAMSTGHDVSDSGSKKTRADTNAKMQGAVEDAATQANQKVVSDTDASSASLHDEDASMELGDSGAGDASTSTPSPRERVSLVDFMAWSEVGSSDDPWNDRPADFMCAADGFGYELFAAEDSYFVNTAKCAYMTATQGSVTDVRVGEEIAARIWYFDLSGPDGAQAHIVLRLGDRDIFDETIPIPAASTLLHTRFIAEEPVPAGTPVYFHVHNHGANEYYMLELSTGPEGT